MNAGMEVWKAWQSFENKARPLRDEYKEVSTSPDLTEDARAKKTWELEREFSELHGPIVAKARGSLAGVEEEALRCLPGALEAAAGAKEPQKTTDMRTLAERAAFPAIGRYVVEVVSQRSLSKAHGLRQAITGHEGLEDEQKAELLGSLDEISAGTTEGAHSSLVGYRIALAGLVGSSIFSPSLALRDPKRAINSFRNAGLIPADTEGGFRQLPESEIKRLSELSGVPLHPPGGKRIGQ